MSVAGSTPLNATLRYFLRRAIGFRRYAPPPFFLLPTTWSWRRALNEATGLQKAMRCRGLEANPLSAKTRGVLCHRLRKLRNRRHLRLRCRYKNPANSDSKALLGDLLGVWSLFRFVFGTNLVELRCGQCIDLRCGLSCAHFL